MVKDKSLLRRLEALGFPLFEAEEEVDASLTLADVVRSRDLRLWEGFPVLLANSASKNYFDYDLTTRYLKNPADKSSFKSLTAMSIAFYRANNLKFPWAQALFAGLGDDQKKDCLRMLKAFKEGEDFKLGAFQMSAQRVKTVFNNYFAQNRASLNEVLAAKEELGLEYALSQLFSPKQKELFLKKLRGEKLTKTEREYFSRAVKKKVLALANTELHRLSRKLLE